jgi:steroid delta-isomerase-like uncharacterized protein
MSEQENIQIVRRLIDNLNKHNLDANVQLLANDVRTEATASPGVMNSREQGQAYTQLFLDAFPDLHFDVKDMIAQGSKVAVSWIVKGTHSAALRTPGGDSIPATNKRITILGCTIYEFRNELVSRQEIYWDQVTLLTQLEIPLEMVQASQSGRGMT